MLFFDSILKFVKKYRTRGGFNVLCKNNVAGVENNYLNNRQFLYKISPDEIVGIGTFIVGKT